MIQNVQVLKRYIQQNPFIEGVVLSDKDCVQISSAFADENTPLKDSSISLMFVAAITQHNDNLQKSCQTRTRSLTLVYEEHIVYFEVWQNVILSIYCTPNANVASLKTISAELNQIFSQKYNEAIEKQVNK